MTTTDDTQQPDDGRHWTEYRRIDDLPPALRNPKAHDLDALCAAFTEFGFGAHGLLDERTGRLVVGHGRTEALAVHRDRGAAPPAGVTVDDDGQWLVPITRGWRSRSDSHAEAYLIADNRLNETGGWYDAALAEMLDDIAADSEALLHATGHTPDDLAALLEAATPPEPPSGDGRDPLPPPWESDRDLGGSGGSAGHDGDTGDPWSPLPPPPRSAPVQAMTLAHRLSMPTLSPCSPTPSTPPRRLRV